MSIVGKNFSTEKRDWSGYFCSSQHFFTKVYRSCNKESFKQVSHNLVLHLEHLWPAPQILSAFISLQIINLYWLIGLSFPNVISAKLASFTHTFLLAPLAIRIHWESIKHCPRHIDTDEYRLYDIFYSNISLLYLFDKKEPNGCWFERPAGNAFVHLQMANCQMPQLTSSSHSWQLTYPILAVTEI